MKKGECEFCHKEKTVFSVDFAGLPSKCVCRECIERRDFVCKELVPFKAIENCNDAIKRGEDMIKFYESEIKMYQERILKHKNRIAGWLDKKKVWESRLPKEE